MDLFELSKKGLIAGPGETEEAFQKRVEYCLSLKENWSQEFGKEVPFASQSAHLGQPIVKEAFELTSPLFDIKPDWIPSFFSNHQLAPWHGGCAWIFQKDDKTPTGTFLQLRKALYKRSAFLFGLYQRKELIAHELCHAGRMMFHEPRFEEMLAYQTSSSWLQKTFGSIIRSSIESMVFVLTIFALVLIDIMVSVSGYEYLLSGLMWLFFIPFGMVVFASFRLWRSRRMFKKCLSRLEQIYDARCAHAVIYRLTDKEIETFSKISKEEILSYAKKMKNEEIRWQQIYEYFRRC